MNSRLLQILLVAVVLLGGSFCGQYDDPPTRRQSTGDFVDRLEYWRKKEGMDSSKSLETKEEQKFPFAHKPDPNLLGEEHHNKKGADSSSKLPPVQQPPHQLYKSQPNLQSHKLQTDAQVEATQHNSPDVSEQEAEPLKHEAADPSKPIPWSKIPRDKIVQRRVLSKWRQHTQQKKQERQLELEKQQQKAKEEQERLLAEKQKQEALQKEQETYLMIGNIIHNFIETEGSFVGQFNAFQARLNKLGLPKRHEIWKILDTFESVKNEHLPFANQLINVQAHKTSCAKLTALDSVVETYLSKWITGTEALLNKYSTMGKAIQKLKQEKIYKNQQVVRIFALQRPPRYELFFMQLRDVVPAECASLVPKMLSLANRIKAPREILLYPADVRVSMEIQKLQKGYAKKLNLKPKTKLLKDQTLSLSVFEDGLLFEGDISKKEKRLFVPAAQTACNFGQDGAFVAFKFERGVAQIENPAQDVRAALQRFTQNYCPTEWFGQQVLTNTRPDNKLVSRPQEVQQYAQDFEKVKEVAQPVFKEIINVGKRRQHFENVVQEIFKTEEDFLRFLTQFYEWLVSLELKSTHQAATVQEMFRQLIHKHKSFLDEMKTAKGDTVCTRVQAFSKVVVKHFPDWIDLYTNYVRQFNVLNRVLVNLNKDGFEEQVKQLKETTTQSPPAFFIMPVQRPPRYRLLFTELLKLTPAKCTQDAESMLSYATQIADIIQNERTKSDHAGFLHQLELSKSAEANPQRRVLFLPSAVTVVEMEEIANQQPAKSGNLLKRLFTKKTKKIEEAPPPMPETTTESSKSSKHLSVGVVTDGLFLSGKIESDNDELFLPASKTTCKKVDGVPTFSFNKYKSIRIPSKEEKLVRALDELCNICLN